MPESRLAFAQTALSSVCDRKRLERYRRIRGCKEGPKVKKGKAKRTRGDTLRDLSAYANSHNGDTLTVSSWNVLGLTRDISRAKTHFLALTLRRTDSSNPRTYYSLIEAEVLPWTVLEAIYANRGNFTDLSPVSPRAMLEQDAERRKPDGALGSVMVISIELPEGDNRPPRDALKELNVHIMQPLGLFDVHKNSLSRLPSLSKALYIKCLENSLKGGAYSMRFQPYVP